MCYIFLRMHSQACVPSITFCCSQVYAGSLVIIDVARKAARLIVPRRQAARPSPKRGTGPAQQRVAAPARCRRATACAPPPHLLQRQHQVDRRLRRPQLVHPTEGISAAALLAQPACRRGTQCLWELDEAIADHDPDREGGRVAAPSATVGHHGQVQQLLHLRFRRVIGDVMLERVEVRHQEHQLPTRRLPHLNQCQAKRLRHFHAQGSFRPELRCHLRRRLHTEPLERL